MFEYKGVFFEIKYNYNRPIGKWSVNCLELGWKNRQFDCNYHFQDIINLIHYRIDIILLEKRRSTIANWIAGSITVGLWLFLLLVFGW